MEKIFTLFNKPGLKNKFPNAVTVNQVKFWPPFHCFPTIQIRMIRKLTNQSPIYAVAEPMRGYVKQFILRLLF